MDTPVQKIIGEEIDLIGIFKTLYREKKTIIISVIISCSIGLIYSFTSPKEYKSEVRLLVESGGLGSNSLLMQLGSMAGLGNLNAAGMDPLMPVLYPDVINSKPFLIEVMNTQVSDSRYDSTLKVIEYLDRHTRPGTFSLIFEYTVLLPFKIKDALSKKKEPPYINLDYNQGPLVMTKDISDLLESLEERIGAEHDPTTNTIDIVVKMQDPKLSAVIADSVVTLLTEYITDYRTSKARKDLEFVQERFYDSQNQYLNAQKELAAFRDLNKNIVLASVQSREQKLQADFNVAVSLYTMMSQQLEQAKIKVQENTPVFKIIEPAEVPILKSSPITTLILIGMAFLGFIAGAGIIFGRKLSTQMKNLWDQ